MENEEWRMGNFQNRVSLKRGSLKCGISKSENLQGKAAGSLSKFACDFLPKN